MTKLTFRTSLATLVAAAVAGALLLAPDASGAVASAADLDRARPAFATVGLSFGNTVDEADVRRLADRLGVDVGARVDTEDVDRVVAAARRRAAAATPTPTPSPTPTPTPTPRAAEGSRPTPVPTATTELEQAFAALGVGYGNTIDHEDLLRLAARLGIEVGSRVDPEDVARLVTAAHRHIDVRYPVFAYAHDLPLRQPTTTVELIGFHQANHDGARDLAPATTATRMVTLDSRDRGTGRRTAADIVTPRGTEVRAPVTGRVLRSGTYVLYCRHSDDFAVIEPDGYPGWEVKLLHIDGVRVRAGDRVVAGQTVLASGPTPLPFRSQIDAQTSGDPHVHIEVVDTAIPDIPSPGGGGC